MVMHSHESLGVVPFTPRENVRNSSRKSTRGSTPATKQVVPNTVSARKSGGRRQRGGEPQQKRQPSPEEIAHRGGLYFDMEGRPVFVEMNPAAFYGDGLMRPFIKLDEGNKPVKDRPFQPKLPNEPLLEWGRHAKWEKGGLRQTPPNASQATLQKRTQELKEPLPLRPRAAWQFYAEELIQKATNARDRFEGDDLAVRQLITNEVRGLDKKRHRWVVPHTDDEVAGTSKRGKWAQLSAVEQEKYIKMHNEDVKRYDHQMEAWQRVNSNVQSKAAEQCIKRIASRKEQAEQESQAQQHGEQQQGVQQDEQQPQQPQGQEAIHDTLVESGTKRQRHGEQEGQTKQATQASKKGDKKDSRMKGQTKGSQPKQQQRGRKGKGAEEEAEEGHSDEEEEEEQLPPQKHQKTSSPSRKVLADADSKLNKISPRLGGVVTKKQLASTPQASPAKTRPTPTRASSRVK